MISKQTVKIILAALLFSSLLVLGFQGANHIIRGSDAAIIKSLSAISGFELSACLGALIFVASISFALSKNKSLKDKSAQFENIFNHIIPICVTNTNYEILYANKPYWSLWGKADEKPIKCYKHRPGEFCQTNDCALHQVINGAKQYTCESHKMSGGTNRYFLVTATPYVDSNNKISAIIESFQEITDRKQLEYENEQLISHLNKSLDQMKLLSGFLPICASCKSIKDKKGDWYRIEEYIPNHSEAQFSHGICPECAKKIYPEVYQG